MGKGRGRGRGGHSPADIIDCLSSLECLPVGCRCPKWSQDLGRCWNCS